MSYAARLSSGHGGYYGSAEQVASRYGDPRVMVSDPHLRRSVHMEAPITLTVEPQPEVSMKSQYTPNPADGKVKEMAKVTLSDSVSETESRELSTDERDVKSVSVAETGPDATDGTGAGTESEVLDYSSWTYDHRQLRMIGTPYEIKCEVTLAYYEGYVVEFIEQSQCAVVAYPNAWKATHEVPLSSVRPMLGPFPRDWIPRIGEEIECKAKAEHSEPFGFWDAKVRSIRDGMYVVGFNGWDDLYNQVLARGMLRPRNRSPSMQQSSQMLRKEWPIPISIEYDDGETVPIFFDELKRIRECSGVLHLGFHPPSTNDRRNHDGKLVGVGTRKQLQNCEVLVRYLWQIQEKMLAKLYGEKLLTKLQNMTRETELLKSCVRETFTFDEAYTRFLIGRGGETVREAKSTRGVFDIRIEDGVCHIFAESREAARKCRSMLEFFVSYIEVPRNLAGELVGKGGENIRKIEEKSRVVHVVSLERHCRVLKQDVDEIQVRYDIPSEAEDRRIFVIFGPRGNIALAKSLIDADLSSARAEREMIEKNQELDQELRSFKGYHAISHFESGSSPSAREGGPPTGSRRRGRGSGSGTTGSGGGGSGSSALPSLGGAPTDSGLGGSPGASGLGIGSGSAPASRRIRGKRDKNQPWGVTTSVKSTSDSFAIGSGVRSKRGGMGSSGPSGGASGSRTEELDGFGDSPGGGNELRDDMPPQSSEEQRYVEAGRADYDPESVSDDRGSYAFDEEERPPRATPSRSSKKGQVYVRKGGS